MFIKEKDYSNAIQKVRINIGTYLGMEKDDEVYIVLRELPTKEVMKLRKAYSEGDIAVMDFFQNTIPNILDDHNLYETENKKMSGKEVAALIFERIELSSKVMQDYSNANFFTSKSKDESQSK